MLWGKKALRVSAALVVAFAAAHTVERLKAPSLHRTILQSDEVISDHLSAFASDQGSTVPKSASLNGPSGDELEELVRITPVAATAPAPLRGACDPELRLAAVSGAMIHLSLAAPCNPGERIVVRHSGLSFTTRTAANGHAVMVLPALRSQAVVAVYLNDSRLVLGEVAVPDAKDYTRFAVVWEYPAELELRVADGDKVLVGSNVVSGSDHQRVMALGSDSVQSPVMAQVYSLAGADLGDATITGEIRITPASCGRTLRLETVFAAKGVTTRKEHQVAVPLCGTAGDILVLKNLAPAVKVAAPK
jgi:hypothetical protein